MAKKNVHTVYNNDSKRWETKVEKQSKPLSTSFTKQNAMTKSIREAKGRRVEHVIHNKDGKISDKDSYGNDPHPPKDRKY